MNVGAGQVRDRIAALIALFDEVIYGAISGPELTVALEGLEDDWLGGYDGDALRGLLGSMPGRETDDSGLSLLTRHLVGPAPDVEPRVSHSLHALAAALEVRQIDLMPLFLAFAAGPMPPQAGEAGQFGAIAVRGGWVSTSLGPAGGDRHDPWLRHLAWAASAAQTARQAVAHLLREFPDAPDAGAQPDVSCGIWPPYVRGADHAVSLGIALDLLAAVTGLPTEHRGPDRQFVGQFTQDYELVPMSKDELLGRAAALGHAAGQTVAVTSAGWCCADGGEESRGQSVPVLSAGPATLDEAARLVWGERWLDWKRQRHKAAVQRLGWTLLDQHASPQIPYFVKPPQVLQLLGHFLAEPKHTGDPDEQEPDDELATVPPQRVAVLGGPAGSGKSVTAQLVARALGERKRPWDIRILSSDIRELPDRHGIAEAARRAFLAGVTTPGRPRLLVLDDILPIGSGAVGEILLHLARTADCRVLCCLQYDTHSETIWDTDRVSIFPAIAGEAALRDFIDQLDESYEQLDGKRGHSELGNAGGLDLRRLIRVMGREHDEELHAALRDLHGEALTFVLRAAAACLTRGAVTADPAATAEDDAFRQFDIIRSPDGFPSMASPGDSRRVLEWALRSGRDEDGGQPPAEPPTIDEVCRFIVELSAPQFEQLFENGDPSAVSRLLCARLYHPRICADLLERARLSGALERWAEQQTATRLAQFLLGLRRTLDADSKRIIQQAFTGRLLDDSSPLPLNDLMLVVRCLRQQLPDLQDRLTLLLGWVHWQVTFLVEERRRGWRDGSADQCLQLMRLVESFHDGELNALVTERIVDILGDLDPQRAADYYLVPQVIRLQARAARNAGPGNVSQHPVLMEPDVRRLWDCEPPRLAPFHLHMARILVRSIARMDTWEAMIKEVAEFLPGALRLTAVPDLIALLAELRRMSWHGGEIMNWADSRSRDGTNFRAEFMAMLRIKLRQATPIEAAELLRLVHSLHARAASRLVCVREGVPDADLARALAIKARSDAKAAGMLLSAASLVDDLYLRDAPALATLIAEELGKTWVLERLRKDIRPSVKYYLMKGIWAAEASFREDCQQAVLDVTSAGLRESLRPWGPRLAMMIGNDPAIGRMFLTELRKRVTVQDILRGMSVWSSPEVQAEYHRLGRAMFPDLASLFIPQFDLNRTAQRLVGVSSAVSVAECTRELHRTLGSQDDAEGASALLRETNRTPGREQVWADRLTEIEGGQEFAQVVNILADVDRARVREIVKTEFGQRVITRAGAEDPEPVVCNMARHMMYDSAGGACAMLAALERHAGLGRSTYLYLREDHWPMKVFTAELSWMQNPVEQCAAAVDLAHAGIYPDEPYTEWMAINYNLKRGLVPGYSGPGALLAVVRMMLAWKREWAQDIAGQISHDLLARRLSQGRTTDLAPAVQLAAMLLTEGDSAGCRSILDALERLGAPRVVHAVALSDGVTLLSIADHLGHPATPDLAQAINAAVGQGLRQGIVFDDHALWTEIGQACHTLAMQSRAVTATVLQPARRIFQLDTPTLVWGLQRLKSSRWRDDTYKSALARLVATPPRDPAGISTGLAAAAVAGQLFDVPGEELRRLPEASYRTLANLCEVAETSGALDMLLRPLHADLARRADGREAWGNWHAKRLSLSLTRHSRGLPAVV